MIGWLRQHRFALGAALTTVGKTPGSFLFNVLVIGLALTLPFTGATLLDNIKPLAQQIAVDPEISVFMQGDASREDATALTPQLRALVGAQHAKIDFISREQALEALRERANLGDVLTTLGENPLPDSFVITLPDLASNAAVGDIDALVERLQALPKVESVHLDSDWVKRLAALLGVLRLALLLLGATLGIVVIAVVFNTIRLQVLTQKEEISIAKLLGATDNFIRRPFYYTGALLGLCAGAVALLIVGVALQPLNGSIAEFAQLYGSSFALLPLGVVESAVLLAVSALLGLIGALLSVRRHLARLR